MKHHDTMAPRQRLRIAARRMALAVTLVAGLLALAGCATTDDGDMPWATPASWEGSPFIPGLSE